MSNDQNDIFGTADDEFYGPSDHPDGLKGGEVSEVPCCRCGGPVVEFTIANADWNTIIRPAGIEHENEYLCVECFGAVAAGRIRLLRDELADANADFAQAHAIVAKLPKTVDGVTIQHGDHVYVSCDVAGYYSQGAGKAVKFHVQSTKGGTHLVTTFGPNSDVRQFYPTELYSTREAAEAAIEQERTERGGE